MRTCPRPTVPALSIACLILTIGPAPLAAQASSVSGRVIERLSQSPLVGVMVGVPDAGVHALTDSAGFFRLEGLRAGPHRVVMDELGYQPVDRVVDFPDGGVATLLVGIRPVELAEIDVQVDRLEARRRRVAASSQVFRPSDFERLLVDPATFLRSRGRLRPAACGRISGCVRTRGQTLVMQLFLDDQATVGGFDFLAGIPPEIIGRMEVFPTCGMVRVYTKRHLERLARTGHRLLPVDCFPQRAR